MTKDLQKALENLEFSKLLNEVLDKFDKQSHRVNGISFTISSKSLPSLYGSDNFELKYDLEILINEKIFILKQSKKEEFLSFEEKQKAKLFFNTSKEQLVREFYGRKKIKSQKESWNELLENYFEKGSKLYDILEKTPFFIKGKSNKEVLEKLKHWVKSNNKTRFKRHESAKCFWGISKLFDYKEEFCSYFNLQEKPVMIQVYGKSKKFSKILFIENLETFSSCCDSTNPVFSEFILINAYGYKTSARRVREKNGSKLFFSDACKLDNINKAEFISWFYSDDNSKEVYFWGDLDYEGITILSAHQKSFSCLKAWTLTYDLMIKEILSGNSHDAISSEKKEQRLIKSTLCNYTNETLIPFLKEKELFYDQEGIDINLIGECNK